MGSRTGIIILAAGSSSRLGHPKQLLEFNGKSLLRHIVGEALQIKSHVIVVTGSNNELIQKEISGTGAQPVFNESWENGMGASIAFGIQKLLERQPDIENCILTVCDQPHVSTETLQQLIAIHLQSGKGIVASQYASTLGTPALFHKKYFTLLLHLSGKEGAKKILLDHPEDVASIPFEKGMVDIDTQEDYDRLKQIP